VTPSGGHRAGVSSRPVTAEESPILIPGPWSHAFVPAHGGRFHVALTGPEDGTAPLVVLLHAFPQFWWAWRHQLIALGDAGFRVAAMDLRGFGASDKPPIGHATPALVRDVAGVIRSLGARSAVVVGHGLGGTIAWSIPTLAPSVTRAVAVVANPHPVTLHTIRPGLLPVGAAAQVAQFQLPWFPERSLRSGALVEKILRGWAAPGWEPPVARYVAAMRLPFVAHSAMEHLRWLVRSTPRPDGGRYLAAVRTEIEVPVLHVEGGQDRFLGHSTARRDSGWVTGPFRAETIPGAGHFLPEEAPRRLSELLVDWLRSLPED
jgi:pimeloyl-ACP methyl ester carboxylesterase